MPIPNVLNAMDFTTGALSLTVPATVAINFDLGTTDPSDPFSSAKFFSSQFGGAGILTTAQVTGSAGRDLLHFAMDTTTLDLSGLILNSWTQGNGFSGDNVLIDGTLGNDIITGSDGFNTINGFDGADIIVANHNDAVFAGNGDDTVTFNGVSLFGALLDGSTSGGAGTDLLIVNQAAATANLSNGIAASGVMGEFEQFQFNTGSGHDTLRGGNLGDTFNSGAGNDDLFGNGGNDQLNGGGGRDTIDGGTGDDTIYGGTEGDSITGGIGIDTIYGEGGNDMIDGEDGNDFIYGGAGFDVIDGGIGNDTIEGGSSRDFLDGGIGNDLILGGLGSDTLSGGGGADKFKYTSSNQGRDTIEDFSNNDLILVENTAFNLGADPQNAALLASRFISKASGHTATSTSQRFIYDRADDSLWYDSNGSGAGGTIVKLFDLDTNYNFLAADMYVI